MLFTLGNRIYLKASFQPGQEPQLIIMTGPPTVPCWDLNPGPLSLEANTLQTELTKPDTFNNMSGMIIIV